MEGPTLTLRPTLFVRIRTSDRSTFNMVRAHSSEGPPLALNYFHLKAHGPFHERVQSKEIYKYMCMTLYVILGGLYTGQDVEFKLSQGLQVQVIMIEWSRNLERVAPQRYNSSSLRYDQPLYLYN